MRRGSQEPTFEIAPVPKGGFDSLDGDDAIAFAARFGLILDPWQAQLCRLWMRRDAQTGKWCAGTWGISVPRQNGKNGALEAVELYGMVVLGLRFMHSAHEIKTAQKHFRRMKEFFGEKKNDPNARHPELNRLVKSVRSVNGQEAIYLHNPDDLDESGNPRDLGWIEVVARTGGSGRGFTNDVLVLDEAQHLQDEQLEASRPAISAAPSGDPVAIYMGTPPKPEALSEEGKGAAFMRVRNSAVTGDHERAAWMEFGHDVDLEAMTDDEIRRFASDMSHSARVNPALGRRLSEQTLRDELQELGPRSYCRERLNIWPQPRKEGDGAVPFDAWSSDSATLDVDDVDPDWRLAAIGLDMDLTGRVWVAAAVHSDGQGVHVELDEDDVLAAGVDAAVERIWKVCRKRLPVVLPSDSGAALLEAPLRAKGVKVYRLNVHEQAQVAQGLVQSLKDGTLTHLDDPVLAQAVRESARTVMDGGRWRLARSGELAAAPLLAAGCARHGAIRWTRRVIPDPNRQSGRSPAGRSSGRRAAARR